MPILITAPDQRPDEVQPGRPRTSGGWSMNLVWLSFVLGAAIVSYAHSIGNRALEGQKTHFTIFWIGVFTFLLPALWKLLSRKTRDLDRYLLVIAIGLYSYFPKFLAYPGRPAFFDEYAHTVQTDRLFDTGLLFLPNNQVVIIGDYPVMHAFVASIRHLTGLSTYVASVIMIMTLHVIALIAIFAIAARITDSRHVGGIAAAFYGIGPGFWGFNTMFAYETFAIILFLWSMVALVHMLMSESTAWSRTGWLIIGIIISFTLSGTHHLSSYLNLIVIGAFVAASLYMLIRKRELPENFWEGLIFFMVTLAFVGWWFINQAPNTKDYLQPYIQGGLSDTFGFLSTSESGGGDAPAQRKLFEGSTIPLYEQILSFATPVISMLVAGLSLLVQWKRGLKRSTALGITLTAGVYFIVYPMMLSAQGAEGARRSWSFTSAGLAIVAAIGIQAVTLWKRPTLRVMGTFAVMGTMAILMIGNLAVGLNEVYRFSGRFIYGSDTRSVTNEIVDAADWFARTQGVDQKLIGDRTSQIVFHQHAHVQLGVPDGAYPIWDFILSDTPPSEYLLDRVAEEGLRYVVVDKRGTTNIPMIGFYLDQKEPLAGGRKAPLSRATLDKWEKMDYALRIYESNEMMIFRLDQSAFDTSYRQVGNIGSTIGSSR